ncbi:hypothetical protein M758_3G210400 [Ceratodon purpureus]|nr:hypothetical protein M758_3G210400 [Ceratodon purpureus]
MFGSLLQTGFEFQKRQSATLLLLFCVYALTRVLSVVSLLGTFHFGSVDTLDKILEDASESPRMLFRVLEDSTDDSRSLSSLSFHCLSNDNRFGSVWIKHTYVGV